MKLLLKKAARQGLDRMPAKAAEAMLQRLELVAVSPFAKHANVTSLQGMRDCFRLRQGDWRAVYRVDRVAGELRVVLVDVRGSAYR